MIISDLIENDAKLEEQLVEIHKIQREIFGYDNQIIMVKSYFNETEYYASDVESAGKKLEQAFTSMDLELIRKQNELLKKTILSLDKVSKLYLQNILYSIIKSLYDKSPKIEMEEVLASSEGMFRAKDARTMLEIYGESMDKMLDSLALEKQDDSRIIHKIKNLVEKDYAKDISLNYVAENVNLTPAYISYIFKKETGQTLVKYITDVKMMKAKIMLEEGTLKIVQIAKACGYENQSYFNRLFKNYYGITPKQLREKI